MNKNIEPLMSIVDYFFKINLANLKSKSLNSFFDDGLSFPNLISQLFFEGERIPQILKNPKNREQRDRNNHFALQFLLKKNKDIMKMNPSFKSKNDRYNLLKLIFSKQVYNVNPDNLVRISNQIFLSSRAKFDSFNDLQSPVYIYNLLMLLSINECFVYGDVYEDMNKYLEDINGSFNLPITFDKKSFNKQNQDLLMIQIQIILDLYRIIVDKRIEIYKLKIPTKEKYEKERQISQKHLGKNDFMQEINEDKKLLITVNSIGLKGGFRFNDFIDSISNDSIPKFVMYYLNISIPNVIINQSKSHSNNENLTNAEINNIDLVIDYLKKSKKRFELYIFDFHNKSLQKYSAILFYKTFINSFFLKISKDEIIERVSTIFCTTYLQNISKNDIKLTDKNIIAGLLHFIINGNLQFDYSCEIFLSHLKKYFKEAQVPMIMFTDDLYYQYNEHIMPDSILYQYQFIFNHLDNCSISHKMLEFLMKRLKIIRNVHVPNSNVLLSNIRTKLLSIKLQHENLSLLNNNNNNNNNNDDENNKNNDSENESKIEKIPISYKDRCKTIKSMDCKNIDNNNISELKKKDVLKIIYDFWNPIPSFSYDNGIIFDKSKINEQSEKIWNNEMDLIQQSIQSNQTSKKNNQDNPFYESSINNIKNKLKILYYYNTKIGKWRVNKSGLKFLNYILKPAQRDFVNGFGNNLIITIINSNENDSIKIGSHFINGCYPDLSSSEYGIFVYMLAEKLYEYDYRKTLPIFLLLHVTDEYKNYPRIKTITAQMYAYLNMITNISITIINKNYYQEQINFLQTIFSIENEKDSDEEIIRYINETCDDLINLYLKENKDDIDDYDYEYDAINDYLNIEFKAEENLRYCPKYQIISDEKEKNFEEEEDYIDLSDNEEYKEIYKSTKYSKPIFNQKGSVILLINDLYKKNLNEAINNSSFFSKLIPETDRKIKMHYINVDDQNTYYSFLDQIYEEAFIYDKVNYFRFIKNIVRMRMVNSISERYMLLRSQKEWKEDLKKSVLYHYSLYESLMSPVFNNLYILFKTHENLFKFLPNSDLEFYKEWNSVLNTKKLEYCRMNRDVLIREIKISSDLDLEDIKEKINERFYWTENQLQVFLSSHIQFLKEEFFEIIQIISDGKTYDTIYQENIDILENQITEDKEKIQTLFKNFIENINLKKMIKEHKVHDNASKNTDYILKETEMIKEIQITVQIKKDLKTEIDQDF